MALSVADRVGVMRAGRLEQVAGTAGGIGRVVTRTFSGATRLLVALPGGVEVRVDLPSAGSQRLTPGTPVSVVPAERPVLVVPAQPGVRSAGE